MYILFQNLLKTFLITLNTNAQYTYQRKELMKSGNSIAENITDSTYRLQLYPNKKNLPSILIVEDDPFSQKLFTYVISQISKKYRPTPAKSYGDLKSLLPNLFEVKLAIIDINLESEKNGFDALTLLKDRADSIPCILTTGFSNQKYEETIESLNTQIPLIRKPFLPEKCRLIIEKYLLP